jgi:RNA polymerase sigma factor (TIGR02999 family)
MKVLVPAPFYTAFSSIAKPPLRSTAPEQPQRTQTPQDWNFLPAAAVRPDGPNILAVGDGESKRKSHPGFSDRRAGKCCHAREEPTAGAAIATTRAPAYDQETCRPAPPRRAGEYTMNPPDDLTVRLNQLLRSDSVTDKEELYRLVQQELHNIARGLMKGERPGHTLQATALVNDAFVKLAGRKETGFADRKHFFCAAAEAMRRLLVDHARRRSAAVRGGDRRRQADVLLAEIAAPVATLGVDLLALDRALRTLEQLDPQRGRIFLLKYFSGHTVTEIAEILDLGEATVGRQLRAGKAWLRGEVERLRDDDAFRAEVRRLEEEAPHTDPD